MSTSEILSNLSKTPSPFHAVALLRERLLSGGYEEIDERKGKPLVPGKGYFLTRNGSSLIAFFLPASFRPSFRLSMVHLDSPTWKLKPSPVIEREEGTLLNVEPYGGLIDYTWFDRPLTLAGRLLVKEGKAIVSRLFYVDKDLAVIPSLAIHLNRGVNESAHFDRSRQTLPLFALGKVDFPSFLAKEAGVEKDSIRGFDLFLASRAKATLLGENGEFIGSPRLDDLASAYSSFEGFLASRKGLDIPVYAAFDNEEVGSLTRQGANSTFLRDCLSMIAEKASFSLREAAASSFALSIDNAHATHPNYVEYQDRTSPVRLGGGIVLKHAASESYTTNALSASLVREIAHRVELPLQEFTNRSDLRGGSTLGNLSNSEISILSADIGIPQLAMHSSYEVCASKDVEAMAKFVASFYETSFWVEEDGFSFE